MDMERFEGRPAVMDGRSEVERRTYEFLDEVGVEYETLWHEAAFTMEECERVERKLGAPVCKNLFLCNRQKTQFYLVMLPGDKVFKTKDITWQLGCARLSFAGEEDMVKMLGIHPGAVSPMGLMNDVDKRVTLAVDKDLTGSEWLGCHPCVNTATVKLRVSEFLDKFLPATGHDYTLVTL